MNLSSAIMDRNAHTYYNIMANVKLSFSMVIHSLLLFTFIYTLIVVALIFGVYTQQRHELLLYYSYALQSYEANNYNLLLQNINNGMYYFWSVFKKVFIINLYLWIFYPLILIFMKKRKENSNYIRGAILEDAEEINKKIGNEETNLPIGSINLPIKEEVKHFFIGGRPGTGKTNMFNQWLAKIKANKKKAIIYDNKGDFIPKFYDPTTDHILNPLDTRCVRWTIFNDVTSTMDLVAVANSIIPSAPKGTAPIWYDAPRDILYGILLYCYVNNKRTNKDVWELLKTEPSKLYKMFKFCEGAERAAKVFESAEETLASILMMLMQYAKIFELLQHIDGDFSVREWIKSDETNFFFISNYADIKDTMKPIISLFVETAGRAILSLPDDITRRIYIFLDEFGTIQRMDTIVDLLTLSRSKGGAIFIGIQDIGRIDSIYGKELRESIINACGNNLIFAVEDTSTAEFFSKKLGAVEYWEDQQNLSMGDANNRVSVSKVKRKEDIVLPSEIQALKDLTAYLKLANYGITYTEFQYKSIPSNEEAFKLNEIFLLDKKSIKVTTDEEIANEPKKKSSTSIKKNQQDIDEENQQEMDDQFNNADVSINGNMKLDSIESSKPKVTNSRFRT